jgi:hypothetical protein
VDLTSGISWWLPPLGLVIMALVLGVVAWILSWRWSYTYMWITNMHVAVIVAPPPLLLPFMERDAELLQLRRVWRVRHYINGIGNLIGEGSVTMDSELETDKRFVPLRRVPNPIQFEEVANAQRLGQQMQ